MKKIIVLIIAIFTINVVNVVNAQQYVPFPDTNAFWGDKGWNIFSSSFCFNTRYGINGDTVINGNNYKKIYSLYDSTLTSPNSTYFAAIREQDKRVYTVIDSFPEEILYDFNLAIGDTITYYYSLLWNKVDTFSRVVTGVDSVLLLNGQYRQRWAFAPVDTDRPDTVIEGIGSIYNRGLFNPLVNDMLTDGDEWQFQCFKQNDTVLYLNNPDCNRCFCKFLTDIESVKTPNKLLIYPNPAKDNLTIETNINTEQKIEIINLIGQTVYTTIINKKATINTSAFARGVYILKLYNDKESVVRKFVKE